MYEKLGKTTATAFSSSCCQLIYRMKSDCVLTTSRLNKTGERRKVMTRSDFSSLLALFIRIFRLFLTFELSRVNISLSSLLSIPEITPPLRPFLKHIPLNSRPSDKIILSNWDEMLQHVVISDGNQEYVLYGIYYSFQAKCLLLKIELPVALQPWTDQTVRQSAVSDGLPPSPWSCSCSYAPPP